MAVDEFAEDGGRRDGGDLCRREGDDVVEELQHAGGLGVGWGRRRDPAQERLGVVFQDGQLEDVGRIEDGVGILLEREDVAVLPASDALPPHDCVLRNDATGAVVTDHATEHSVVGGGDVVVFVDGEGCESRCIDTEDLGRVDSRYHGRIQGMDTLHDEDVLLVELHHVAAEATPSFLEVEAGNFDRLAFQELVELLSEEVQVHGAQCLEVILAFLVDRRAVSVDEVVVQFDDLRVHPEDAALE